MPKANVGRLLREPLSKRVSFESVLHSVSFEKREKYDRFDYFSYFNDIPGTFLMVEPRVFFVLCYVHNNLH